MWQDVSDLQDKSVRNMKFDLNRGINTSTAPNADPELNRRHIIRTLIDGIKANCETNNTEWYHLDIHNLFRGVKNEAEGLVERPQDIAWALKLGLSVIGTQWLHCMHEVSDKIINLFGGMTLDQWDNNNNTMTEYSRANGATVVTIEAGHADSQDAHDAATKCARNAVASLGMSPELTPAAIANAITVKNYKTFVPLHPGQTASQAVIDAANSTTNPCVPGMVLTLGGQNPVTLRPDEHVLMLNPDVAKMYSQIPAGRPGGIGLTGDRIEGLTPQQVAAMTFKYPPSAATP